MLNVAWRSTLRWIRCGSTAESFAQATAGLATPAAASYQPARWQLDGNTNFTPGYRLQHRWTLARRIARPCQWVWSSAVHGFERRLGFLDILRLEWYRAESASCRARYVASIFLIISKRLLPEPGNLWLESGPPYHQAPNATFLNNGAVDASDLRMPTEIVHEL